MAKNLAGKFITLEGSEGSGKSTQSALLEKYLKDKGYSVLLLREPGGVSISENIRSMLLNVKNTAMSKECETLLYMAARAQLVEEIIRPALEKRTIVICDRFLDSTLVYQGYGHGIDLKLIECVGEFATQGIKPDLTFLFDIDSAQGLSRIQRAKDRIELRSLDYHNRVRQGYLALAKKEPKRIKVINVNESKEKIFEKVKSHVDRVL
ncbi:MAG: dTMP kinase [Candidatus Omnitrophica bacterium]|nr:dTMP kinase [Candidatus Omnitrophota bacterium]